MIQLQRHGRWLSKQAFDKPDATPPRFVDESVVHQRGGNAANEDFLSVTVCRTQGEVDGIGNSLKLEREQSCYVDSVPGCCQHRSVFAFDKADAVLFTARPVVLRDFHESQRRVLVLVSRLDQQNVLVSHSEILPLRLSVMTLCYSHSIQFRAASHQENLTPTDLG